MRVGIDASNLRAGGGVTHLVELLRAAKPQEYGFTQVIVWAGRQTLDQLSVDQPWLKLVHEPLLDKSLPYRTYWQRVELPKLARKSCDILFIPGGHSVNGFRPYVTMCQNMLPFEYREIRRYDFSWMFLRNLLLRLIQTHAFRKANGVIFLNDYARKIVMENIKNFQGHWSNIPHGINRSFYLAPREQSPLNAFSSSNPLRFLYVSIVNVYKHQWHVVEAIAKLVNEGFPVTLDLIGPAYLPSLKRLQTIIQVVDPTEKFIRYHGPVPYLQLPDIYHQADAFVFASSCENMPNILLEAMASGLPIACSNRGPMPEILGDAGVYFDPEQPDEIANAVRQLLENSDLRTRCASGAYEKAKIYSWERCANETFGFINRVAKEFRHV